MYHVISCSFNDECTAIGFCTIYTRDTHIGKYKKRECAYVRASVGVEGLSITFIEVVLVIKYD